MPEKPTICEYGLPSYAETPVPSGRARALPLMAFMFGGGIDKGEEAVFN